MELEKLHKRFEPIVRPAMTHSHGKKSQYTTYDTHFMVLTVFKKGGSWDFLASLFKIGAPAFWCSINRYVETVGRKA